MNNNDWVPDWLRNHEDSTDYTKLDPLPDPLNLQPIVRKQFKNREFISLDIKVPT